ncbi:MULTISPECIES: YggS family pyridoxal phosphate-dependent enzyme [unclassified Bosea (in: a-proteobacteria)]|uniref:YggS family pyridoxal phosphate-dependent enzyme n=1 Tax=unclassified Bosea (in: a-proteobacteria) TaxID=2653178 RepID=UPI000F757661|nr:MULTISPECIES: YggS family pyridoxal phosphate-dependent enzyme [unclassified Bosea (in: a-proteobacteria)]AZO79871.1 YggS family pyridoxal phosphate enzyme [Bosea sp. Tri-49]RXT15867.1 YggS family pyridoxal phosphate enzyme [Bosea sp. Tri-39]RXT39560.1 YggS family pyridoxal phosphate enzyme [Bosea sp. Tri-54]
MAMQDVAARLQETRAAIARAARDFGRKPEVVTLVAVSKTKPAEAILPALEAGQVDFGENYVQEASAKWPALRGRFPQTRLHMIGPLQSNKARDAVALFDVIHSLDRESLAKELAREIERAGKAPQLIVQVNTGAEPQKGGVLPGEIDAFLELCRTRYGLTIAGLMCIPPAEDQPSPHFGLLAKIAKRNGLAILSMGMSADYEAAIQLGATHVRVGSAIFGARG